MFYTAKLWRATNVLSRDAINSAARQAEEMQKSLQLSEMSANAARDQAQIASDALRRSNRAWVVLLLNVEMVTPLSFSDTSAHCKIRLTVKNVGKSPAINTIMVQDLVVGPCNADPKNYVTKINDGFLKTIGDGGFGVPVVPGDPMKWRTTEVRGDTSKAKISQKDKVSVWLNGYLGYRDEFRLPHTSSFLFSFITSEGNRCILPGKTIEGRFEPFGVGWDSN
jgi:hypothetical protein